MSGLFRASLGLRRASSRKPPRLRQRVLRSELLEPRTLLSGYGYSSIVMGSTHAAMVNALAPTNAAPTVTQPMNVNGNLPVTGRSALLSVLGSDDRGESNLVYSWSVTRSPIGGRATFDVNGSNAAKDATVTFTKAGTYKLVVKIVDTGGRWVKNAKTVTVSRTLTSINISTADRRLVTPGTTLTVPGVSQTIVAQGVDQFGRALATQPAFTWSIATVPASAPMPTLSANRARATVTFASAGMYDVAVQARAAASVSVTRDVSLGVTQVVSGVGNTSTDPVYVSGTSQQLVLPTFVDQFGSTMSSPPAVTWSTASLPAGAPAPSFTNDGGTTTVAFGMAGSYRLTARVVSTPSIASTTTLIVNRTLTSIAVSPDEACVFQGATQQFTAQAFDQFQQSLASQPTFTWSTSGGTINASGLFTAPSDVADCTVTARSGSVTGAATVTILSSSGNWQNAALGTLVQSLDVDGSINRQDMIQILRSTGADGAVDATEFADLQTLLSQAATLNIPGYVQVLAGDIVSGNAANAKFQGQPLGNLAVGSSSTQLDKLIDKWFLGADHPALCSSSLVYRSTAGSLFPHTPSHTDERQGQLGDCYFISALGTLADSNPAAVQNMFIDNGDGTYTVRFYTGNYGSIYNYRDGSISAGFRDNIGTADYVTVDRMLPTTAGGMLVYANYGASYTNTANALWIPLAEKAYAQWNETGKEGRDGQNAYASIQGGWMATVDAQVLGYNATDYIMTRTDKQVAISALATHKALTIGTLSWSGTQYGLYATHAYAIIGYNASSDTFTLYNPWGSNQPGPLTWGQLQATCSQLAVADTSGSIPIAVSSAIVQSASAGISYFDGALLPFSGIAPSESAAATVPQARLTPAVARSGQAFDTASTLRRLFERFEGSWAVEARCAPHVGQIRGVLSATLVDATFTAEGFLPLNEV